MELGECPQERWQDGVWVRGILSTVILFSAKILILSYVRIWAFVALVAKNLPANAGDVRGMGSISGWERSPGGWHGNPLKYSCLENLMDRGVKQATDYGAANSQT